MYAEGGIFLLIHRMTATFGKLQGQSLELKEGLNILQAPNESGKSTWCAFLVSMLYGINSRERDRAGFIADKNRYAPWSGTAMSGRMECSVDRQAITLSRTTRRQTSPMSEFQAVYTGTADTVPGLAGTTCGETLLGVSREVFERSAFIRQSGLAISQDAGLERRIAALITSGEEDTSYTEAADTLKKQLNRRRHNRTGQLPVLEAELLDLNRQIDAVSALEHQLTAARSQVEVLNEQESALVAELTAIHRWEAAQKRQVLAEAEATAETALQAAQDLRRRIQAEQIPENDTIGRLRGAIVNLTTVRRSAEKARDERDEAMKALLKAEAALNESPFAGQTPEQVRREIGEPPKVKANAIPAVLAGWAVLAVVAAAVYFLIWAHPMAIPAGIPFGVAVTAALSRSAKKKAQAALTKRFGTADLTEIETLADTYYKLYEQRETAQADLNTKSATADALYASLSSNEQGILLEVRRFAPAAFDISTADQLLRSCAQRRKELNEAEAAAREATLRCELLRQQTSDSPEEAVSTEPPARSREAVTAQLDDDRARLSAARSSCDRLSGQLNACGDPIVLRSSAEQLAGQITDLEAEYDAIVLAMSALDTANTTLQNRFSPELGRRAAEIFGQLTEGQYSGVVLDRSFHLSAEPQGDTVYRDAGLLSAGTVDQLYLATRLAICDLVLPKDKAIPLVLDDALTNFDDRRCTAALRWLKEAAKTRQIILFTCHSREAEFFAGDEEVFVQRLTDTV